MTQLTRISALLGARQARSGSVGRVLEDRSAGLDALRAIACLLVVVFHMRTMLVVDFGPLNPVIEGGNSGVFVFFALSGYLLYRPFLRGTVDLRSYSIKRAARILPGYFVALVALVSLTGNQLAFQHPLPYLTMSSSYSIPLRDLLGVAWTLSAEILFYVLLPLTAWLVKGREILRLSTIAAVSVGLALLHRILLHEDNLWLVGAFPMVAYAFVPGMILAVVEVRHPAVFQRLAGPLVAALGTALVVIGCLHYADPVALPTGVGTALVMSWLLHHRVPGTRALAFLGGASYAMYLWHRDLMISFGVVGVALAAVGAAASWAIVERPVLEWAHRVSAGWRAKPVVEPIAVGSSATP